MKTRVLVAILHCALLLSAQSDIFHHHRHSRIAIQNPDASTIARLQSTGIDMACGSHISLKNGIRTLEVECSEQELDILTQQRIPYTILIRDLEEFYAQRTIANLGNAKATLSDLKLHKPLQRSETESCRSHEFPVPMNFTLGDLGGFLYYEQILAVLDSMAVLYPDLISVRAALSDNIFTRQGRPVFWVKISDHVTSDEPEPEVLYTALTHAREPAGAMSLLYYMWYLLENYESDPEVRRIVDHTELYFIPVVNPDGYIHNETIAPQGGGMWRKNLNDNDGNTLIDGEDGVDLNRNYGYLWGHDNIGSSPNPSVSTYRGESAFSEPETQMIRDFVLQHDFVTAMNDHSYGNDLYHAWEHGPSPLPDAEVLYRLSDLMTWDNRYLFGESHSTYWLGAINGGANDWLYGEQTLKPKIFSWLPEIGTAFWPDPLEIVQICADQVMPHMMAAKIAGQHAEMHDLNSPSLTYGVNSLTFRIEDIGLQRGNFRMDLIPTGQVISEYSIQDDGIISFREILESKEIAVHITVDHRAADGATIEFELLLQGDDYEVAHLHYSGVVNALSLVRHEESSDIAEHWKTDFWGMCPDPVDPGKVWITDSPDGTQLNMLNTIKLKEAVNLQDVSWAKVNFNARWSIETSHDFVQLQARADGGAWRALCGRYTKSGAKGNVIDIPSPHAGQPLGEPVYDGRQLEWIQEIVDLSDFVGLKNVEFQFVAWSGGSVSPDTEDGFYFTDFNVLTSRKVHCADQMQNADEEGVDCGGTDCAPCATCNDGIHNGNEEETDCGGDLCSPCPSCADGQLNQDETGIDCGGDFCSPCITCDDGIQNGNETGLDCGGDCIACAPACDDGILNGEEEDIDCGGTLCHPCITCEDGLQNGSETGIDCGGDCVACAPTCDDGIMNGDEENVDCGGRCPDVCKTHCCAQDTYDAWYHFAGLAIEILPNPVNDQLSIKAIWLENISHKPNAFSWEIMDLRGVKINRGEVHTNGETSVNVSSLTPQLYLIRIADSHGNLVVQRFLKQD